ncbi:MAG: reverse transcriptase-like protein [Bacillus sp. (in: firmicutes)]
MEKYLKERVRKIEKTTHQNTPVSLLLKDELIQKLNKSKPEINAYLQDGMPHYVFGNEYRFIETEVKTWLKTYKPSQERLESEFRDKKGRTLEEYVTQEVILETLRIPMEKLVGLCRKGMPHARVGEKEFFHVQDILDHYRQGDGKDTGEAPSQAPKNKANGPTTAKAQNTRKGTLNQKQPKNTPKKHQTKNCKKQLLMPLCKMFPKEVPFLIIDGSYDYQNHLAGSGLVLVENWEQATAYSNVRKIETTKSIVSEYLALLDALLVIKEKNIKKAVIVTDQKKWSKGISINAKKFEASFKPYIKEFNRLWSELRGQVKVKFVGDLETDALHKKAHKLSQEHKTSTTENVEI